MSKDLLNKIRGAIDNNNAPEPVKPEASGEVEATNQVAGIPKQVKQKPDFEKVKPNAKKESAKRVVPGKGVTGFEELQELLKAEKEGFIFNRRLVYIDDNVGEALDILRKKAKINSNVLASYLLKQFLLENKDLIKSLTGKNKDNMFLD